MILKFNEFISESSNDYDGELNDQIEAELSELCDAHLSLGDEIQVKYNGEVIGYTSDDKIDSREIPQIIDTITKYMKKHYKLSGYKTNISRKQTSIDFYIP